MTCCQGFALKCNGVALVAQSCLTLCNPTDCGLPVSSVHGILQARILEWVAVYTYMYLFFFKSFLPLRLLQNIEQSSLCYAVGLVGYLF